MSSGVLIIEDEERLAKNIQTSLNRAGFDALKVGTGTEGLAEIERFKPDIVLLDYRLPDMNGLEVLERLRRVDTRVHVIMMTGEGSIEMAVAAMKAGAQDYLTKPLDLKALKLTLQKAVGQERLEGRLDYYQQREADRSGSDKLLGESRPVKDLKRLIERIVQADHVLKQETPASVLVTGETGTGKELVARAIHFDGPRRDKPFIEVNCAAIPAHLLEAELFGYERGAFTDARQRKFGLVEAADGGTLFLDEIGEVDPSVQSKLLKLLEDRVVRRLGGLRDREIDVRIVAATNQPLEERIRDGRFRSDLYYRLKILQVELPPLRARDGDVLLLAEDLLARFSARYGKSDLRYSEATKKALCAHDWPGNVRELRNAIEQTVLLAHDKIIEPGQLGLGSTGVQRAGLDAGPADTAVDGTALHLPEGGVDLEDLERSMVVQALERTGGNVTKAARLLGLTRDTMRYRIEKFSLSRAS